MNWISAKERLPEDDRTVLLWFGGEEAATGYLSNIGVPRRWFYIDESIVFAAVTHWMELPAPPQFDEADHENPETPHAE